jgi:hypothetical protein
LFHVVGNGLGVRTETTHSLAPPVVGWRPSGTPWFGLADQQAIYFSWKALDTLSVSTNFLFPKKFYDAAFLFVMRYAEDLCHVCYHAQ